MLTDEDLTRELGEAFRSATSELSYNGRTRPPRGIAVPVTAVAAASVAVALVGFNLADSSHSAGTPTASGRIAPSVSTPASPTKTVTDTLQLAGLTLRIEHAAGTPNPVLASLYNSDLPSDAQPVTVDESNVQAWSGTDPATGDNAIFVKALDKDNIDNAKYFELLSSTWTTQQLIDLFEGPPSPVPLLSPAS